MSINNHILEKHLAIQSTKSSSDVDTMSTHSSNSIVGQNPKKVQNKLFVNNCQELPEKRESSNSTNLIQLDDTFLVLAKKMRNENSKISNMKKQISKDFLSIYKSKASTKIQINTINPIINSSVRPFTLPPENTKSNGKLILIKII